MNLVYGVIAEVRSGRGQRLGKVRVGGAAKIISLDLLTDPAPGDKVLVCEGVALAKVEEPVI
ncbi:MAG TPA: HypC/HybG/HupF family hydrogenase formation chaperone [Candidatus Methylacidiphilales bacterium]|nr:HypC/HybG/HupF family hydrogenase formation chaperone [Candidatus Methylacidiphilales bacterium]